MHLGKIAAEQPGKAAVIMAGSGHRIAFAELNAAANRLAHVLFDSATSTPEPLPRTSRRSLDDPHRD